MPIESSVSFAKVSILLPTLNEADNLPLMLPKIADAMGDRAYEVLVVDDNSRDATPAVCAELATRYPLRLHVRTQPKDGLSGAVLDGIKLTTGEVIVVMDSDLQHPPEAIPKLVELLDTDQADFVIGSRYVPGGSTAEKWGVLRKANSLFATFLARPFAGQTHDPMSGFFALKRSTFAAAQRLTPLGYKIGLELMCKCRVQRVREVPIHFSTRAKGESKLTLKQQFKYLEHLSRLYDFTYPRVSSFAKFLIATACGWGIALSVYGVMLSWGVKSIWAPTLAYPLAILVTTVFHFRYVRTQREFLVSRHPWGDFWVISLAEWIVCFLTALWATARIANLGALELFLLTFGAATVARYMLRKEFLQDIRGLRRDLRAEEWRG